MRQYDCCFRYHTDYIVDESRTVGTVEETKKIGITITGTIGILTQAFDEGMLTKDDVERCIEWLQESGIRISEKLYQKLREYVGLV